MARLASSKVRARDTTLRANRPKVGDSPGASVKPAVKVRWHYVRLYLGWLRPNARALAGLFGLAVVAAVLDLVWPLLMKQMIDSLENGRRGAVEGEVDRRMMWLVIWSAGVVVVLVVKQGVELFRSYRTAVVNAKVLYRLRRKLFGTMLGLPLGKLSEMKSGGIVSRLSSDVDQVSGLVQQAIISPSVAILRIVLTMGVLLYLSWELAVASLVALPPVAVLTFLWLRRVRPIYRSMIEDRSEVDARVNETFGGIRVVRAFRRESREARDFALGTHTVIRKMLRANRLEFMLENGWGLLIPLASLVVVGYGGYLYVNGRGELGDIFAFQIYSVLLLGPVVQMVSSVSGTQRSLAAMERVFDTLGEAMDKPDRAGAVEAPGVVERIRFANVGFAYTADGPAVLKGIELEVTGGQMVALVGASGAGKTTMTDLVCRFYDPVSGHIEVNGVDLRDIRLASYRGLLAVVHQETFLFDGSVHENIAYGRRGVTREEVVEAARRANAHEFIAALPAGYDTAVGERGFKLSGGQRQRLSIARAMLARPRILILDEATSSLDTESEQLIQGALGELFKGRAGGGMTSFVIAHRLSTIVSADLIVVLEKGEIVERGTHEELMGRGGRYAEMVARQRLGGLGE